MWISGRQADQLTNVETNPNRLYKQTFLHQLWNN